MAQLERRKKLSESPNSPKSQSSPSSDQLLRVEETYWATNASPNGRACHDHEHEECPNGCSSHNKKSVLAKVRETAKKLKYSLSGRRKHIEVHDHEPHDHHRQSHSHDAHNHCQRHSHSHEDDHNHRQSHSHSHEDYHNHRQSHSHSHDVHEEHHDHITPCWTATLEDDYLNEKDYDPEYLGAPMYESEAAPECLKETARQHPRAVPVVSESHKAPNMTKHEAELQESDNKPVSSDTNMITNMTQAVSEKLAPAINTNMITNMTQTVSDKLAPACAAVSDATHQINTNMIANVTGTVSEKLAPACAAVSDATHQIATKLAGITVTSPETQQRAHETSGYSGETVTLLRQGAEVKKMGEDSGNLMQCTSGSPQTWDKGVSVKEYFLHKLEPGEDERALSQAITEAISPRKSTGEAGVVDKVKGAVTSLFWQEDASNSIEKPEGLNSNALANSDIPRTVELNCVDTIHLEKPARPSPVAPATSNVPLTAQLNRVPSIHIRSSKILSTDNTIPSPLIPVSTNALEVYEEENQGKILQTN